jgi:DNA primase large subunit
MPTTQTDSKEGAITRNPDMPEKAGIEALRANGMMAHLLESLEKGKDIGHYGRLVFAMIARHFLGQDELMARLCMDPSFDEAQAKVLIRQVESRDYNPPRPERIREWQAQQEFPICPTGDPDGCNVYRDLKFPEHIYQNIERYQEKKAEAESEAA